MGGQKTVIFVGGVCQLFASFDALSCWIYNPTLHMTSLVHLFYTLCMSATDFNGILDSHKILFSTINMTAVILFQPFMKDKTYFMPSCLDDYLVSHIFINI